MEFFKDLLNRLPIFLFLGVYLVVIACDMKTFLDDDPASPYFQKKEEVKTLEAQVTDLQQKEKQAEVFFKEYQARREALLERAKELKNMKNTLSDNMKQEEVMSIVSRLARDSGLKQKSLQPQAEIVNALYFEKPFTFEFEGLYEQLMVFLKRLSEEERIFKVDNYRLSPRGDQFGKFILLSGVLDIRVYWYNSSKADSIGTNLEG